MAASTAFLFAPGPVDDPGLAEEDVLARDADGTLAFVVEQRRRADQAAAQELRAVTHWCDLHRAVGVVGAVAEDLHHEHVHQPLLGREGELRLAGEGAFAVEEYAVSELAAGLGMSEPAARAYVGQALELRDRLPRLWAKVQAGVLPAWRARQVAADTIPLTAAAADYVDRHLAPFAARVSLGRIRRAVRAAILRHDPETAREHAQEALDGRGMWVGPELDGVTTITAVASVPDAVAFETAVDGVATALAALGDTDRAQVRRSKALGVLADPQYALDVRATVDADRPSPVAHPRHPVSPGCPGRSTSPTSSSGSAPVLRLHVHADAVAGSLPGGGGAVARVGRFGPHSLETVQAWLRELAPDARIQVLPVVDLGERISVDAYEAPERLRAQIEERDTGCMFPWCGRQGRFDLDHAEEFLPPEHGGPPGQTSTDNLTRLCRFHHRAKTHAGRHGRWRYRRNPAGTLIWISPLGRRYAVDETGTAPLD